MRLSRLLIAMGVVGCALSSACTTGEHDPGARMFDGGVCAPGARACADGWSLACSEDGQGFVQDEPCDATAGSFCDDRSGRCVDPCAAAEASHSNIGCEYWPVTTLNPQVADEIAFGVVVANGEPFEATITVERDGAPVASAVVEAGGVQTIVLPWVETVKGTETTRLRYSSNVTRGGAYRLRSNIPVVAYQFNPLHYRVEQDCANERRLSLPEDDHQCYSFSNDASLLLPPHALTGNYRVLTWPSIVNRGEQDGAVGFGGAPGFVTIVGVEETPVEVTVRLGAAVLRSDTSDEITSARAGDTITFTLAAGDVAQLVSEMPEICGDASRSEIMGAQLVTYCILPDAYDLTGTEVRATGRVSVLTGHACAFVPIDKWSCDHLEETVPPLETLSDHVVVVPSEPFEDQPNVLRVMSASDDNHVHFDPPVHDDVVLDRGEFVELEIRASVEVQGTGPLLAAQFMVGQSYDGIDRTLEAGGDPSMSFAIPVAQYRDHYTFLTPDTYDESWVAVTAPIGSAVTLDGTAVTGFAPVGAGAMASTRVTVEAGVHVMESGSPFSIVVYGVGAYTSYAYPGGLDLRPITAPF